MPGPVSLPSGVAGQRPAKRLIRNGCYSAIVLPLLYPDIGP